MPPKYFQIITLCLILPLFTLGCGNRSEGPKRYELTGEVTYDGKPVPLGDIMFSPDTSKGNDGPSSLIKVVDGKFHSESGQGHVGGPYTATLIGFDGESSNKPDPLGTRARGTILFRNYTVSIDFPKSVAYEKFDVPKKTKN